MPVFRAVCAAAPAVAPTHLLPRAGLGACAPRALRAVRAPCGRTLRACAHGPGPAGVGFRRRLAARWRPHVCRPLSRGRTPRPPF